jgi:hypothetical protein
MNSYINRLKKVTTYLELIQKEYPNSVLWELLHSASWHYKIDWVYWIEDNKNFIEQIKSKSFQNLTDDDVQIPFYKSVQEIKDFTR